jgi:hypothetical protein
VTRLLYLEEELKLGSGNTASGLGGGCSIGRYNTASGIGDPEAGSDVGLKKLMMMTLLLPKLLGTGCLDRGS